jgi:two-component system, cell cycle response regulator DivK
VDILLVDDNPLMQQLMERFLGDLGYTVAVAGRADEAIALASDSPPALFLLDMYLPDLDGPDVLHALHALPNCAATPAIAMSGMDEGAIQPGRLAGFAAYLAKPVDLDVLEATVAQHIGDRRARSIG